MRLDGDEMRALVEEGLFSDHLGLAHQEGSLMSHYNLSPTLGIDRFIPSGDIHSYVDRVLELGVSKNPGGEDEVKIARAVLGDDARRALYDSRLDNPEAPDITVDAIRDLALLDVASEQESLESDTREEFGFGYQDIKNAFLLVVADDSIVSHPEDFPGAIPFVVFGFDGPKLSYARDP